ncbi:MAG: phenylalanine--tRNA ligase subunit beta [Clostridiales bacterium]|nr:phenylalanine--tRNA ligase subunit beta [Clostridiales bacterium]
MKVPVKWLNEHVKIDDIDIKFLEDRLIMSGSNTEGVKDFSKNNTDIVIGKVIEQVKHEDADKLFVLQIDLGEEITQIVTGAKNVKVGDYVPVAKVGANLANGLKIKKGKLRGQVSNGMLCSLDELGFEKSVIPKIFDDGIYILQGEYELGTPLFDVVDIGDNVIEFEITPNRPDCLSIEGMARETQATFKRERKKLSDQNIFEEKNVKKYFDVEVQDSDLCPRYSGFVINNVQIKPSPQWMQVRLMLAGVRPINNIVDITNYVMLETGQPIHPFDLDLVDDKKIIVRRAFDGEKMTTLDSVERILKNDDLVIASAHKAIGIAGVMGGENTEITENTKNIFVEVANFNKTAIRMTSKHLGLRTEASARFEKGIDINRVGKAVNRLLELYAQLNVGEIVDGMIDIYPTRKEEDIVILTTQEVKRILGIDLSTSKMKEMLESLEFKVLSLDDNHLKIQVPSFRMDVLKEIDMIEEVARMYGYDNIPVTLPGGVEFGEYNYRQKIENTVKSTLVSQGLYEISTYSFVSPTAIDKINRSDDTSLNQFVRLINPLGEEYSVMRTTLLPNMMEVLTRNQNNGNSEMMAFELGNTFIAKSIPVVDLPDERKSICIGAYGKKVDFFKIKSFVELLFEVLGIKNVKFEKINDILTYHPGRLAKIIVDETLFGIIGEIHPDVMKNFGISSRVIAAEIDFEKIAENSNLAKLYEPVPKYPSIQRDIAILVKDETTHSEIVDLILKNGGKNLVDVKLFDIYRGVQIKQGYKSMAYSMTFRSDEKTLTDEEVQKPYDKILRVLEETLDAIRR